MVGTSGQLLVAAVLAKWYSDPDSETCRHWKVRTAYFSCMNGSDVAVAGTLCVHFAPGLLHMGSGVLVSAKVHSIYRVAVLFGGRTMYVGGCII